eukprot:jgi/Mesvir1/28443/Mv15867-RA.1
MQAVDFARGSKHVAEQTLLLSRLAVKLLGYLGVGYKWISKLLRLILFSMLLLPGFAQVGIFYIFSRRVIKSVVYGKYPRNRLDIYLPHPAGVAAAPTTRPPRRSPPRSSAPAGTRDDVIGDIAALNGDGPMATSTGNTRGLQCPSCRLHSNAGVGVPEPLISGRASLDGPRPSQPFDVPSLLESIGGGEALPLELSPGTCHGQEAGMVAVCGSRAAAGSSGQGCAGGGGCCRDKGCEYLQGAPGSGLRGLHVKVPKRRDVMQDGSVVAQDGNPVAWPCYCACRKTSDDKECQQRPSMVASLDCVADFDASTDGACVQRYECGTTSTCGGATSGVMRRSVSAQGNADVDADAGGSALMNDSDNAGGKGASEAGGGFAADAGTGDGGRGGGTLRRPESLLRALSWPSLRLSSWLGGSGSAGAGAGDLSPCSSDDSVTGGGKSGARERPLIPVVVYVTGGAWIIGYKAWGALLGQRLARRGVLAVCLDYRNFPQGVASDMVNDITQGIGWVLQNIRLYGGDPNRVLVVGQSAGAHLSACVLFNQAVRDGMRADHATASVTCTAAGSDRTAAIDIPSTMGTGMLCPTLPMDALGQACPPTSNICGYRQQNGGDCHMCGSTDGPPQHMCGCDASEPGPAPFHATHGGCSTCPATGDKLSGGQAPVPDVAASHKVVATAAWALHKDMPPGVLQETPTNDSGNMNGVVINNYSSGSRDTNRRVNNSSETKNGPECRDKEDSVSEGSSARSSHAEGGDPAKSASSGNCDQWAPATLVGWVGVSGGYDMEELVEHFHQRGLYRSIFRSIMEEALPKFSPTQTCRLPHFRAAASTRLPPILLLHGMADHSIPYASSVAFATAIQEAGLTDVRLKLLPGKSHTDFILSDPFRGQQDILMEELLGTLWGEEGTLGVIRQFGRGPQTVPSFLVDIARKVCPF